MPDGEIGFASDVIACGRASAARETAHIAWQLISGTAARSNVQPGPQAGSWYSTIGNGFRVDQAWLSPPLANRLVLAELDHSVRLAGYSDHSLLVVELEGE